MKESKKLVNIYESDYNTMALIAQKTGLLYPEGHTVAGKMIPAEVMKHIIKVYAEATKNV